jgi:signal transduction histidine kinase
MAETDGEGRGRGAGRGQGMGAGPGSGAGRGVALANAGGEVIVPGIGFPVGTELAATTLAEGLPVEVNGERVGTLLGRDTPVASDPAAERFLERVNVALVVAALGATVAALLLGVLLARTLTRPLRDLTTATQAVAGGELGRQVDVPSQDELGELAGAFNQMSRDLAYAQERRQQLTADIAHDLRTPISIIQGHAEALRDGVLPPETETFDLIYDEARRLHRLVEDLRTLSRAEAGELDLLPRPVPVRPLLEQTVAAHTPQAQSQEVTLALQVSPGLPPIAVDPDRIAQVLSNLVDNALRHTPPGGTVSITAQSPAAGEQLPLPTGHWLLLTVRDSGPGIQPEDLPHIFERFYRGDKSRRRHAGGSGLGLAIARSLVEGHGGRIWVESEPGAGAAFHLLLPVAPPAA